MREPPNITFLGDRVSHMPGLHQTHGVTNSNTELVTLLPPFPELELQVCITLSVCGQGPRACPPKYYF